MNNAKYKKQYTFLLKTWISSKQHEISNFKQDKNDAKFYKNTKRKQFLISWRKTKTIQLNNNSKTINISSQCLDKIYKNPEINTF